MISIQNLNFSYLDNNVFNNINIEFKSPGKYLIIGDNASGKSTFLNLLSGFLNFYDGKIYFDNIDVSQNINSLRSLISYLPENIKFNSNMKVENLLKLFNIKKNNEFDLLGIDCNKKYNSLSEAFRYRFIIFLALSFKKYLLIDDLYKLQDSNNNISKIINEHLKGVTLITCSPKMINEIIWDSVYKITGRQIKHV